MSLRENGYNPGSNRASRPLPFLTGSPGGGPDLLPALPALDGRGLRGLLAHVWSLGGRINFFEAGSSPFGTWGEVLLRDPLIATAALLESEPQEDDRPARLGHLLGLTRSLPAVRAFLENGLEPEDTDSQLAAFLSEEQRGRAFTRIDQAVREELVWQNLWAARLEQAGLPCPHPLYNEREERAESGFSNSLPGFLERDFPGYARLLGKKPGEREAVSDRDASMAGKVSEGDTANAGYAAAGGGTRISGESAEEEWDASALESDDVGLGGFQWLLENVELEFARAAPVHRGLAASLRDALDSLKELALLLSLRRAALLEHAGAAWRELSGNPRGLLSPHTGILLSFLRLYAGLQADQNALPAAHADYFYRRLLGFAPALTRPDRALVSFKPEDGAPFFRLPAGTRLLADNPTPLGPEDAELEFRTLEAAPVNPARLTEVLAITPPHGANGPLPGPWCRVGDYSAIFGAYAEATPDNPACSVRDIWPDTAETGALRACPTLISLPDFELSGGGRWLEIRIGLAAPDKIAGGCACARERTLEAPACSKLLLSAPEAAGRLDVTESGGAAALTGKPQGEPAIDTRGEPGHTLSVELKNTWNRLQKTGLGKAERAPAWLGAEFSTAGGWSAPEIFRMELRFAEKLAGQAMETESSEAAIGTLDQRPSAERPLTGWEYLNSRLRLAEDALPLRVFDFEELPGAPTAADHLESAAANDEQDGPNAETAGHTGEAVSRPEVATGAGDEAGAELILRLFLSADQPALAAAETEVHGFTSAWPVLRLLPDTNLLLSAPAMPGGSSAVAAAGWSGTSTPENPEEDDLCKIRNENGSIAEIAGQFWKVLADFQVFSVKIGVNVRDLRDFLVGSGGSLVPNPRDTGFEPFGGAPATSDSFILEVPELKNKRIRRLRARWNWNAPDSFAAYFKPYPFEPIRVSPAWRSGGGSWHELGESGAPDGVGRESFFVNGTPRNGVPEGDGPEVELTGGVLRHLDCIFPPTPSCGADQDAYGAALSASGPVGAEESADVTRRAEWGEKLAARPGLTGLRWRISSSGSLFGHQDYPALQARAALNESSLLRRSFAFLTRGLTLRRLNPPFTPLWHDLAVDYDTQAHYGPEEVSHLLDHAHPFQILRESADVPPAAVSGDMAGSISENTLSGTGRGELPLEFWETAGCWPGGDSAALSDQADLLDRPKLAGRPGQAAPTHPPVFTDRPGRPLPRLFAHYDSYSLCLGFTVPELTLEAERATVRRGVGVQSSSASPLSLYFSLQNKLALPAGQGGPLLVGGTLLTDDTAALSRSGLLRVMPGWGSQPGQSGRNMPGADAAQAAGVTSEAHTLPVAPVDASRPTLPPFPACPPGHSGAGALFLPFSGSGPHFRLRLAWPGEHGQPNFALQGVHGNAVWAEWAAPWRGALPGEADEPSARPFPLPAGSLSRLGPRKAESGPALSAPLARYLDTLQVEQPYPSIGGRPAAPVAAPSFISGFDTFSGSEADRVSSAPEGETPGRAAATALAAFWQDSAESLSHREQALLPRDYERIALRDYPEIMSALCLPHCDGDPRLVAPGSVCLAVFAPQEGAKIRHGSVASGAPASGKATAKSVSAAFTLNPSLPAYADAALLERLAEDLRGRSSPFATLRVLQPHYQPLRLRLCALCDPWANVSQAGKEAREALERVIAPWAFEPSAAAFGQSLGLEALLESIRQLPWLTGMRECLLHGPAAGAAEEKDDVRLDLLAAPPRRLAPATPYSLFYPQRLEIRLTAGVPR